MACDGEIRAPGGGPRRHHRYRLQPPEASALSPPATLNPDQGLNALVRTLRGKAFAELPFFDQKQVIRLLDALPDAMKVGWRATTVNDADQRCGPK